MQSSTPPAPNLAETVPTWTDKELFWIIKHGVKFTAMPAWPALSRNDEIQRMTAFVQRLPEMTTDEYRMLAYGRGAICGRRGVGDRKGRSRTACVATQTMAAATSCRSSRDKRQPTWPQCSTTMRTAAEQAA
jgi:hypothetical protein